MLLLAVVPVVGAHGTVVVHHRERPSALHHLHPLLTPKDDCLQKVRTSSLISMEDVSSLIPSWSQEGTPSLIYIFLCSGVYVNFEPHWWRIFCLALLHQPGSRGCSSCGR